MSSTSTACGAVGHSASSVESLCEGGRTSTIELHQRIRQDLGGVPRNAAGSVFDLVAATWGGRGHDGVARGRTHGWEEHPIAHLLGHRPMRLFLAEKTGPTATARPGDV